MRLHSKVAVIEATLGWSQVCPRKNSFAVSEVTLAPKNLNYNGHKLTTVKGMRWSEYQADLCSVVFSPCAIWVPDARSVSEEDSA